MGNFYLALNFPPPRLFGANQRLKIRKLQRNQTFYFEEIGNIFSLLDFLSKWVFHLRPDKFQTQVFWFP